MRLPDLLPYAGGSDRARRSARGTTAGRPPGRADVANFTLPATDGSSVSLHQFAGKKAAVLVFTGTQCPVGNLYLPRLVELQPNVRAARGRLPGDQLERFRVDGRRRRARPRIRPRLPGPQGRKQRRRRPRSGSTGPARSWCSTAKAGSATGGRSTTSTARGPASPQPTANYLADALDAVLAARPIAIASTAVAGCPIERAAAKVGTGRRQAGPGPPRVADDPRRPRGRGGGRPADPTTRSPTPAMSRRSFRRSARLATVPARLGRSRS